MDAPAPGIGEIIGGSQREEHFPKKACPGLDPGWTPVFRQKMRPLKRSGSTCSTQRWWSAASTRHYGWYRDLRRYGTVPRAGFGLGFERTLAYVTGLANVRDAIPFPRTLGNARY